MTTARTRRSGYTLLELLCVVGMLVVLGAVLAPTFMSANRDTRVKAAADLLRARAADARAHAVDEGRIYRLSVSPDGLKLRVAPEDVEAGTALLTEDDEPPLVLEEPFPEKVTAVAQQDMDAPTMSDSTGWVKVATFLPDGTCREDQAVLTVSEPGVSPLLVRVRGLTGATSATPSQKAGSP